MGASKGGEDDGELSDSTRAVLAIQRQLEEDDEDRPIARKKGSNLAAEGPSARRSGGGATRDDVTKAVGDGRERGSVTGIKLGEFAPGVKRAPGTGGFSLKGKDGKERNMGQSLESLANMDAEEGSSAMPEAPEGSFRRRDLASASAVGAEGRPKSQLGIDGKEYAFIEGPGDDASDGGNGNGAENEQEGAAAKGKKRKADGGDGPAKGKKAKKDKDKKAKKKKSKEKAKKKGKTKKKKKQKSSSSSSSSGGSSS